MTEGDGGERTRKDVDLRKVQYEQVPGHPFNWPLDGASTFEIGYRRCLMTNLTELGPGHRVVTAGSVETWEKTRTQVQSSHSSSV